MLHLYDVYKTEKLQFTKILFMDLMKNCATTRRFYAFSNSIEQSTFMI